MDQSSTLDIPTFVKGQPRALVENQGLTRCACEPHGPLPPCIPLICVHLRPLRIYPFIRRWTLMSPRMRPPAPRIQPETPGRVPCASEQGSGASE
mgnify:CR=1 FL=1